MLLDPQRDHELALRYLRERCRGRPDASEDTARRGVGG